MATRYGSLVGAVKRSSPTRLVAMAHEHTTDHIIVRDQIVLAAAPAADKIQLGILGWESMIAPDSTIFFDAMGAGVTFAVGDVTFPAGLAPAAAASAAGNMKVLGGLFIANWFKPLWQQLGYANLEAALKVGAQCELLATIAGGAATGNVVWQIQGQYRI